MYAILSLALTLAYSCRYTGLLYSTLGLGYEETASMVTYNLYLAIMRSWCNYRPSHT